ncbi:helicase-associated domain-containing protein [Brevibacillus ruminantium]|uniref:Helicase-associated domain-containing protein n=1 Tax=Brevibacillus ruminantium TaxID=2950604 RepID=A0ABY4WA23_9BACL|nr:helicase-associated domain-containing protein [Brevibacillus ruminantium]USG63691.1 helicase-associated domain-containing protein [Brevibacillus ruminantium]
MHIQQGIEFLSQTTRQLILDEHAKRLSINDNRELADRLTDPQLIEQYWTQTDAGEKEVITLFVTSATRGFFRKKEWEKWVQNRGHVLSAGLNKLRRMGMILTVRKMWGEVGFIMPREVKETFTLCLIQGRQSKESPPETLPYYISAGRGIHLDLFGVLAYLRDSTVPLTQKGQIHRRILLKLAPLLSISDQHVSGWAEAMLPEVKQEGMALTIVLDVAIRLGLVRSQGRMMILDQTVLGEWLAASPKKRWDDLYSLLVEEYLPHESWWDGLVAVMKHAEPDHWHSIQEQIRTLESAGFEVSTSAAELATKEWLHLLLGFGWIQMGESASGEVYWRWNRLPLLPPTERWFIDPSGMVTIPPLVPLLALWELSFFCPLSFAGDLISGELQAKPLQAYLSAGGKEEDVIAVLQRHCVHPLPESLEQLIYLWGRQTRQIQLEPFIRVRTAHPGLLEEIKGLKPFQRFLGMVISPTEFLVTPEQEKEVMALFRKYGYEPFQARKGRTEALAGEETRQGRQEGLFSIPLPWDGFAVENTFPDQLEGMHHYTTLPKMWTQHFQSYHPQTMRTLLQRASELGLDIQAELGNKEVKEGIPRQLSVEMGYWYVSLESGKKKLRCKLDDIQRVRIVLPEYLY